MKKFRGSRSIYTAHNSFDNVTTNQTTHPDQISGVVLVHNNSLPHTVGRAQQILKQFQWDVPGCCQAHKTVACVALLRQ